MEQARPHDLPLADIGRSRRHSFRAKVSRIGEHGRENGGRAAHLLLRPEMREACREIRPAVHLRQQISNADARQQMVQFPFQILGAGRNLATQRRDDEFAVGKADALELAGARPVGKPLQPEIQHLPHLAEPCIRVGWNAKAEPTVFLLLRKCLLRHQMLVERPECAAAFDRNIARTQPVAQCRKGCYLIKSPTWLSGAEDQLAGLVSKMSDRNLARQGAPACPVQAPQQFNRHDDRIVTP